MAKKEEKKEKKTTKKVVEEEKVEEKNSHILEHKYNPRFELLEEDKVKELTDKYGINILQLPKILLTDPICKLVNAKVNDVFKITRQSYTSGESIFYRVVING